MFDIINDIFWVAYNLGKKHGYNTSSIPFSESRKEAEGVYKGIMESLWEKADERLPIEDKNIILEITPKINGRPFIEIAQYHPFPATKEPHFLTSDDCWNFRDFTFRWMYAPKSKE